MTQVEKQIPSFKCVLIGDGGTGKTTLVKQLINGQFDPKYIATLGVEINSINTSVIYNNKQTDIILNIWDTAGQDKFLGTPDKYYSQTDCALIFFDLTSTHTFKNISYWIDDISKYTKKIILIGNKKDLFHIRKISHQQILQYTRGKIPYIEISSKTCENINQIMPMILNKIIFINNYHIDFSFN
jgi:GTP-binding nuclear protein Ran